MANGRCEDKLEERDHEEADPGVDYHVEFQSRQGCSCRASQKQMAFSNAEEYGRGSTMKRKIESAGYRANSRASVMSYERWPIVGEVNSVWCRNRE